jgi:hypothetical protein
MPYGNLSSNSNSTIKFSLTSSDWNKVLKDNYHKYSIPTGAGADDTMTVKDLVFEQGSLEATLYWCKHFQDLIELKGLDAAAKFMNANILTSSAGHKKWQQAQAEVLGNPPANKTNARFNRTMLTFIQKCGATSETAEYLRDIIMNAKKPSNLRFEDFKQ